LACGRGQSRSTALHEQRTAASRPHGPSDGGKRAEQEAVLDEELASWQKGSDASSLCFLEGKTQDEASANWAGAATPSSAEWKKVRSNSVCGWSDVNCVFLWLDRRNSVQESSAAAVSSALLNSTIKAALDFVQDGLAGVSPPALRPGKRSDENHVLDQVEAVRSGLDDGGSGTTGGMLTYRALFSKTAKAADSRSATPVPKRPTSQGQGRRTGR